MFPMPMETTKRSCMYRNALVTDFLTLGHSIHCCGEGMAQQGKCAVRYCMHQISWIWFSKGIGLLLMANQAKLGYLLHPQFLSCLKKT